MVEIPPNFQALKKNCISRKLACTIFVFLLSLSQIKNWKISHDTLANEDGVVWCKKVIKMIIDVSYTSFIEGIFLLNSLVKLHISQIKKSLTHDQKKHYGREHL